MTTTRTQTPETVSHTDTVLVSIDGAPAIPGSLRKWREVGRFGYVVNWTVTVDGTLGDPFLVPPRHHVLAVTLPNGKTIHGGGIITALSHTAGRTTIHGEGPLSDCAHTDEEDVKFTVGGKHRHLRVCRSCTRFIDLDTAPNRSIHA